eukprot:SAG22_NODE_3738_length_1551_cov_1.577824_2_plen_200_part_00
MRCLSIDPPQVKQEAAARQRLEAVLELIGRMEATAAAAASLEPAAAIEQLAGLYEALHQDYREECAIHGLGRLAIPFLLPLLRKLFATSSWRVADEPTRGVAELARWRPLLMDSGRGGEAGIGLADEQQLFSSLVAEALLPRLRSFITNEWDYRGQCASMVALVRGWQPLVSAALFVNILDQVRGPGLQLGTFAPSHVI